MSWQLLRLSRRCWFCPTILEAGDLARMGEHTPGVWCVACALRQLGETPPAEFLAPASPPLVVEPAPAQDTLFELGPAGAKLKHADARLALEQLRTRITEQAEAAVPAPEGGDPV